MTGQIMNFGILFYSKMLSKMKYFNTLTPRCGAQKKKPKKQTKQKQLITAHCNNVTE